MVDCQLQIGAIVDSFEGQDPFDGDGYVAKGRYMQMQADCSRSNVLQQYLKAMAQYRYAPALYSQHLVLVVHCSFVVLFIPLYTVRFGSDW